jgi:NADPH-dependent 2,4-dienoyl-CoA reductase/sulfur reductase-like enzyme/peroxiredoxin family protein/rhodanese-related sulfurtransferase/TusA-related sulfurtransferase
MAKYLIIGGVASGATTAARLRRNDERAQIVLVERGDYVSYANCGLPYYAGGVISERSKLFVMTPEKFRETLNIDVRVATEATSIDRAAKTVALTELKTGKTYAETYDALILSPGAEPVKPPIPGLDLESVFTLRSVPDIDRIKEWTDLRRPERAVVVGGGFIGLEMAENLAHRGAAVTVIEALDQVMGPIDFEMAAIVHRHLRDKDVELRLKDGVSAFEKRGSRIFVKLSSGDEVPADIVVFSIGVKPDSRLAREAGLETIPAGQPGAGAIIVDEYFRTSDPAIRALGDAVAFKNPITGALGVTPLAGPANKQGRLLADALVYGEKESRPWRGAIGTAAAKVFDLTVASTGANEKVLARAGIPHASVVIHPNNHAGYYPGAVPLTLKLIYSPDGRVLGAQAVGYDGVDKRIDVVAALLGKGAAVSDLAEFEQVYAPPFSSAKDPVNLAAFAAENALKGRSAPISWKQFEEARKAGAFVLDVRTREEAELGSIPGASVIPNTELRDRLAEVPKDKTVLIYCGVGLRGYLAERILRQNGWTDVFNLSGGYKTWQAATERQDNPGAHETRPGKAASCAEPSVQRAVADRGTLTYGEGTGAPEGIAARGAGSVVHVDACGLQCPGPIMRLKAEIDKAAEGSRILLSATDPGFGRDVQSWCKLTGNLLVSLEHTAGRVEALVEKTAGQARLLGAAAPGTAGARLVSQGTNGATLIVFSNDLDKALASFVLANGAAAVGKSVTMFFTFWGLSVIQRKDKPSVAKDLMGRMFSFMLPKHSGTLALSRMNFGGMGPAMMKGRMKSKNVDQLEQMMASALKAGVRLVACQMSMDLMGVTKEELIDGVEIGGVAAYMEAASEAGVNLFI